MNEKIIIAGGGTGGHIFPAIAIANALRQQQPNIDILFIGATGKMEMEKVPQAGYNIKGLTIAGFNRSSLLKNIGLPFKLLKSFFEVRSIFKQYQPNAVIGVGGYSSFPVLRFAQSKGIPTFLHESNSFAGKSNQLLAKKATQIFVAHQGMDVFFPKEKIVITGNPVRASIAQANISKEEALQFFGLQSARKTILAVGGSLGAKSINEAIAHSIDMFETKNLQLIWQTGKASGDKYKAIAKNKPNIWVNDFITEMEMGYAAADIVISRAGAMAVTELCVVGKPTVFVPFPFAAEDHQTANAMALVRQQAAWLVKDADASLLLVQKIVELAESEEDQKRLSTNCKKLAITNADEVIATQVLAAIGKNKKQF